MGNRNVGLKGLLVQSEFLRSPGEVPEGVSDENLGRNSQGHPVVLRNSLRDSLGDFSGTSPGLLRDFSGTFQELRPNQKAFLPEC